MSVRKEDPFLRISGIDSTVKLTKKRKRSQLKPADTVRISGGPRKKIKSAFDPKRKLSTKIVNKYIGGLDKLTKEQKQFFEPIRTKPKGYEFKGTDQTYVKLLDRWIGLNKKKYKFKKINQTDKDILSNIIARRDGKKVPDETGESDKKAQKLINRVEKNREWALRSYAMADIMFGFKEHKKFPERITKGRPVEVKVKTAGVGGGGAGFLEAIIPFVGGLLGLGGDPEEQKGEELETSIREGLLSDPQETGILGPRVPTLSEEQTELERVRRLTSPGHLTPLDVFTLSFDPDYLDSARIRSQGGPGGLTVLDPHIQGGRIGRQIENPDVARNAGLASVWSVEGRDPEGDLRNIGDSLSDLGQTPNTDDEIFPNIEDTFIGVGDSRFNAHGDGLKTTRRENRGRGGIRRGLMIGALVGGLAASGLTNLDVNGVSNPNQVDIFQHGFEGPVTDVFGQPVTDFPEQDITFDPVTGQVIQPDIPRVRVIGAEGIDPREELKFDADGNPRLPPGEESAIRAAISAAVAVVGIGVAGGVDIPEVPTEAEPQPPEVEPEPRPPAQRLPPLVVSIRPDIRTGPTAGAPAGEPGGFPSGVTPPGGGPGPGRVGPQIPVPPEIPCLDIIALFLIKKLANTKQMQTLGLNKFFDEKDRRPEYNKCIIGTVWKSSDIRDKALEIIGPPTRPPISGPTPISGPSPVTPILTPSELTTELQRLIACYSATGPNREQAQRFLHVVVSMQTISSTQKISFLKAFCRI